MMAKYWLLNVIRVLFPFSVYLDEYKPLALYRRKCKAFAFVVFI